MTRNNVHLILIAMCFLSIVVMASPKIQQAVSDDVKKFDLIVRTEISIDAPPSSVWPYLFRANEWKSSIGKLERVAGEPNTEGETLRVIPEGAEAGQGYYIKYVRAEKNRQLVLKIFNIPDDGAVGYSDFSLFESNGKTHLIYDVYVEYKLPGMSDEEVKEFGQQVYDATKSKLESENQKLKELVESINR